MVPSSLQIRWTLYPSYLCTATETARDVAEQYSNSPVVTLRPHPLEKQTMPEKGIHCTPETNKQKKGEGEKFLKILEDFVDYFINIWLKIVGTPATPITCTLPWYSNSITTTVSNKIWNPGPNIWIKIGKGIRPVWNKKGSTRLDFWWRREVHWTSTRQTWKILQSLNLMIRRGGVDFKIFHSVMGKWRHATIDITEVKGLSMSVNLLLLR